MSAKKKIIFIGAVESSELLLETVLSKATEYIEVVGVVTMKSSAINADFKDLTPIAKDNDIDVFYFKNNNENKKSLETWIEAKGAEAIFCFGWSYLINKKLIQKMKFGVWGYHPTKLPANRGRHPIIWTLVLGLKETASTFFIINEKADEGDILSQRVVTVDESDNSRSLYDKLMLVAQEQIIELSEQFFNNRLTPIKQDSSLANNWRKRSKSPDGVIDFRMSARSIYNLVRALTKPYDGAVFKYNGQEYILWRASIVSFGRENDEPGKIIDITNGVPIIKCGEGALALDEISDTLNLKVGDYL